ncbi:MAG: LCP family protein [Clostridia bacterium]|nr:LCP family protein [Clostridia bacterium]
MSQTKGQNSKKNTANKPKTQSRPQKNQVSLAGVAKAPEKKENREKKRFSPWKWMVALAIVAVLLVVGILLFRLWDDTQEEKPALTAREMVAYTSTPDKLAGDVSYYLMGVTGAEVGDPMDMLAVMCFDRKADAVSVVQIPVDTYIDKDLGFAVDTIGNVWHNPQPQIACSSCRELVLEKDRDGQVHAACGAELEEWVGSPVNDLARVINVQYGLPVDNYFILSREGLVKLIDGLNGVRVELKEATTLAETPYDRGVQVLDGQAAVDYAVTYNYRNSPDSDRERMGRQRQVLAALWESIAACSKKDLYYEDEMGATKGVLGRLMLGSDPVRFNTTSFGRARMLGKTDKEAENIGTYDAIAEFAMQLADIPLEKVTFSILPGETEKMGTTKVYSVNRAQLIALLNEQMNPYDLPVDEDTVAAPQLTEVVNEVDLVTVTLDTVLPAAEESEEGEE